MIRGDCPGSGVKNDRTASVIFSSPFPFAGGRGVRGGGAMKDETNKLESTVGLKMVEGKRIRDDVEVRDREKLHREESCFFSVPTIKSEKKGIKVVG